MQTLVIFYLIIVLGAKVLIWLGKVIDPIKFIHADIDYHNSNIETLNSLLSNLKINQHVMHRRRALYFLSVIWHGYCIWVLWGMR